jgi:restriction endonuclease S subunit
VAFGQDCKALLPHTSIDGTFLGLALKSRERDILAMVDEAGHGTGRLPTDLMERLEIAMPADLAEQRRIVEILNAVDAQLTAASVAVAKQERLAEGTLLQLLSPPVAGWRKIQLKDCGTWWSGGTPATEEPRFWGGDIPWISAASLKDFRISDSDRRVTRAGSMAGTKVVDPGTVLFIVRGMSLKSEFRVGVAERSVAFGQDCKALFPKASIDGTFLGLALKSRERDILAMVDEAGHGTGRLPTDMMERLEVAMPAGLTEQRRIVNVVESMDERIRSERVELSRVEALRAGLMEDLLTGQVRV